jgi:hypothetical protein
MQIYIPVLGCFLYGYGQPAAFFFESAAGFVFNEQEGIAFFG